MFHFFRDLLIQKTTKTFSREQDFLPHQDAQQAILAIVPNHILGRWATTDCLGWNLQEIYDANHLWNSGSTHVSIFDSWYSIHAAFLRWLPHFLGWVCSISPLCWFVLPLPISVCILMLSLSSYIGVKNISKCWKKKCDGQNSWYTHRVCARVWQGHGLAFQGSLLFNQTGAGWLMRDTVCIESFMGNTCEWARECN